MIKRSIIFALVAILFSCGDPGSNWENNDDEDKEPFVDELTVLIDLHIITVSDATESPQSVPAKAFDTMPSFTTEPNFMAAFINSGSPEYLKIKLYAIVLEYEDNPAFDLWRGVEEITLSDQEIDIDSIIDLNPAPLGTVISAYAEVDPTGFVKGTLTKEFMLDLSEDYSAEITVHTKQTYSYNSYDSEGGADSYIDFTIGSAEEAEISLGTESFSTSCDLELTEGDSPQLTILFDLSRVLRFYNGLHPDQQGVNPGDIGDKAYFFTHSTFSESVGLFFGTPGEIYGYKTIYASYNPEEPIGSVTPGGVLGWMTLIFDSQDQLLKGHLIGDDDNALTVAKGNIQSFETDETGFVTFTYTIGAAESGTNSFTVSGFEQLTEPGTLTPVTTFESTFQHGEAVFELKYYN